MKIIKMLKELRRKYKSESAMARDLGMSRQALKHIVDGDHQPKDETIMLICEKMNINAEQILIETAVARTHGSAKKVWIQIEKKLASVAAMIVVASTLPSILSDTFSILC